MPSNALDRWQSLTAHRLAALHRALDHAAAGDANDAEARDQAAQAFVIMLAAHFQGFCRDLHNECAMHMIAFAETRSADLARIVQARCLEGRKLCQGGANSATIGADFARFGLDFWIRPALRATAALQARGRVDALAELRNSLAHQDFARSPDHQPPRVSLDQIAAFRAACDTLAVAMDTAMAATLLQYVGAQWRWG